MAGTAASSCASPSPTSSPPPLTSPSLHSYVDSQLQKSKRFDAAGLQRDHPDLFRPLPHRRYSRTSSSASLATEAQPRRDGSHTPAMGGRGGTITPLTMTNLSEALLKRNNSISSSSGEAQSAKRGVQEPDEGQLRYWTNEMCRKSPHLFDFVITVRPAASPPPSLC